jgi:hypothetical protein
MDPEEKSVSLSIQPDGNRVGFQHARLLVKLLLHTKSGYTQRTDLLPNFQFRFCTYGEFYMFYIDRRSLLHMRIMLNCISIGLLAKKVKE